MKKMHPLNALLRLLLELAALATFAAWGYRQADGATGLLLAIALPFGFAVLWGVFAVKNDPSRSGKTVISTPGIIRLFMELALFTLAVIMLFQLKYLLLAEILAGATMLHYLLSYKRISWLLRQK